MAPAIICCTERPSLGTWRPTITPPSAASCTAEVSCRGTPCARWAWRSTIHSVACAQRRYSASCERNGIARTSSGVPKSESRSVASQRTAASRPGGGVIIVRPTGVAGSGRITA